MSRTPILQQSEKRHQNGLTAEEQYSQIDDEGFLRKSQYNKSIYDDRGSQENDKISPSRFSHHEKSMFGETQVDEKPDNYEIPEYDPQEQDEKEEDKKILILKEPTRCTIIPTIEDEKKLIDSNNGLQQKPVDTYLLNCRNFARSNLKKNNIQIQEYVFKKKDFESKVLNTFILDFMLREGGRIDSIHIQEDLIAGCFKNQGIRIFLDYIYSNGKQYLLVKTWQKFSISVPKKKEIKIFNQFINNNRNSLVSATLQRKKSESPTKIQEEGIQQNTQFYIKTFQVLDKLGQAQFEPVIVEQVFGDFDDYRVYDTSTLFRDGKLYYFKRLYLDRNDSQDVGFSEESSEAGNLLNTLNNNTEVYQKNTYSMIFKKLFKQKQILQLHSYDIKLKKETKFSEIWIDEDDPEQNYFQYLQQLLKMKKNVNLNDFRIFRPQNMVNMSVEFGPHIHYKYENEQAWLKQQFFSMQKYTQKQEANIFKIYRINDYSKTNTKNQIIHQMESSEIPEENDCIRQIQYLNHIQDYDKKEKENKTISFLVTNMKSLVQIQFDNKSNKLIKIDQFKKKSTDIYQKIFNSGGIIAQMTTIKNKDGGGRTEDFDQYFYVDSRNQIQLLYPQIEQKVQKLKIIDIIGIKNKIVPKDFSFFKKISCINHIDDLNIQLRNTLQKFENLRQIIDFDDINSRQSITYLKDSESEKLYITDPSTQNILIFYLENSNQIPCKIINEQAQIQSGTSKGGKGKNKDLKDTETNANLNITNQNKEKPTTQTGFDHEEPYLMYKQSASSKTLKKGQMVILDEQERKNHILIDDFNGNKMKVKTYDINGGTQEQKEYQQLRCILYQQSQGGQYCFFLFVVQNTMQVGGSSDAFSDTRIIKKSYIFVRKTHNQMMAIFSSMCKDVIIQYDSDVLIMMNNLTFEDIYFCNIRDYQFRKENLEKIGGNILAADQNSHSKIFEKAPYIEIKIVLSKAADDKCKINFVPMIYQEQQSNLTLKMLLFDIVQFKLSQSISIGPAKHNQDYMYEDEQGYKKFWLCRTSDLHEEYQNQMVQDSLIQRTKYQLFTLYQEKMGRITGEEFLIVYQKSGSRLQTIGQKYMVLSQNIIQDCEWTNIRDSSVVPFYDNFGSIKGCSFMFKTSINSSSQVNLCDQDMNNIYGYKSKILVSGKKQFQISSNAADEHYVVIISSLMRRKLIIKNIFDRQEAFIILERSINLMLTMRVPDLEFLVQNTFEDLKSQDFFQSQEILLGKSICDICLSDPDSIYYACNLFDVANTTNASGSIIEKIIGKDQVRKQAFVQTRFYPKQLIIQIDLNSVGTVRRALFYSNIKSLKTLLNHCFTVIDQLDYQATIMFDLAPIIESSYVQINDFFNISQTEKKDMEVYGFCNLEMEFKNPDLPVFHDKPFDFFIMSQFENFLETERDILKDIQHHNDQTIGEKTHEIEYYYVDFSNMHVGEKIRNIDSDKPIKFDDLYYSKLIKNKCDQGEASSSFFAQDTIQKIIDSQWVLTKHVQKQIFMVYILLYCVPMCVSSFKITDFVDNLMFKIALIPALMLGTIEFIQLLEQKWSYFQGWNIIDTMQIFIYGLLFYMLLTNNTKVLFFPELKLINIILAFMKILFFIRIYEKFGFLVQMIVSCIVALVPFMMAFIVFVLVFAVCYIVLQVELDMDEEIEARGLTMFQKMVLQTFKNSIGELMMPKYSKISLKEDSFFKNVNISLIWMIWCIHTFFQLVIMLNFLIAVISSNYEESTGLQVLIGYQQKAELNYETYMLLNVFKKLDEYKCLVLQCCKTGEVMVKDDSMVKFDDLRKYIERENKFIVGDYNKLNESMEQIKKVQERVQQQMFQKFLQLQNSQNLTKEEVMNKIRVNNGHHNHHQK